MNFLAAMEKAKKRVSQYFPVNAKVNEDATITINDHKVGHITTINGCYSLIDTRNTYNRFLCYL